MKKLDYITLFLVVFLFGGITIANAFQPDRPTESLVEQRKLQDVPDMSLSALLDGSYFADWSAFFSDTFIGRETLVDLSKYLDTLMGVDYTIDGDDSFALLQAEGEKAEVSEEDAAVLQDALDKLLETDPVETEPAETEPVETEPAETEPVETEPAETEPAETEPAETEPAETEPAETEPAETEPVQTVNALYLSRNTLRLTIGSGSVVYATVETSDGKSASVSWSISDSSVAKISKNPGGGVDVKGIAEGECILTCKADGNVKAECTIVVAPVTAVTTDTDNATADFITGGLFIYGDAVYTQAYYSESAAKYYAQTAEYYHSLFNRNTETGPRVSIVTAPVSSMVIDAASITAKIADQGNILDKMRAQAGENINFVDTYTEMFAHKNEYLFFKSDHHWTGLGAYYAYSAYAKSIGLEPTPLDDFDYHVINENYHGTMYTFTKDNRVRAFSDVIEAWVPRKEMTMTITTAGGATLTYNNAVLTNRSDYLTFIAGDNPYTVINVPENPQDFNVLVLKDSFGNAFIPYLCEHYGNIIVVDVRYTTMNIYEHLKDYGLSDIIFMNNVQAALSTSWSKMYLKAVGVE